MKVPTHLAIIMDGNGRWAQLHGRERTFGHLRGARIAKSVIEHCAELGVKHLTLYAFSTENWLRPKTEVAFLMRLLARHMRKERESLVANNIRFTTIGDLARLPEAVQAEVRKTKAATARNDGMHLVFALSYGSRQELTAAARRLAEDVAAGRLTPEDITEDAVRARLETSETPDPDLIIRTSGECRLSNFLMWQAAYSELYVAKTLWPDFTLQELEHAFLSFADRERRFGRTHAQLAPAIAPLETASASLGGLDADLEAEFEIDACDEDCNEPKAAFRGDSIPQTAP